jgi:hypothetical protein
MAMYADFSAPVLGSFPALALAVLTGSVVGALAWREGDRQRQASVVTALAERPAVPLGLLASTIPLIARPDSAAVYVLVWVLAVGVMLAVWSGVMAWRAEGRWREFSLPLALLGLALPLAAWGGAIEGPGGIFVAAAIGWAIACPYLYLAAVLLLDRGRADRIRAAAWGASVALGPGIPGNACIGNVVGAAACLVGMLMFWAYDYMTRTRSPWDRLELWIEKKTALCAAYIAFCLGIAYPFYFGLWLHETNLQFVHRAVLRALPLGQLPLGAILALCLSVMFGLCQYLPDPKIRARVIATACVPPLIWALAAPSLPTDFARAGVLSSLLVMFATCLGRDREYGSTHDQALGDGRRQPLPRAEALT